MLAITACQALVEYGMVVHSLVAGLQAGAAKVIQVGGQHLEAIIIGVVAFLVLWSIRLSRRSG